ncbi:Cytochrome b-c1 complex subunit [Sesamum angolense]|uniref:Cytochrome b-c1 complex subunit n=2 Tax=Sesamum TaxID=4181 RepID=A0AAE1X2K4_9LAMI|nr:Cytochrome b-c1 complex subunit [Sesamum angolense]
MGKQPVRMKAVVYALSPFQQKVMPGLWKDLPGKIAHKISDSWLNATLLLGPLVGTYSAAMLDTIRRKVNRYVQW